MSFISKEGPTVPIVETPQQKEQKDFLTAILTDLLMYESQFMDQQTLKQAQDAVMNPQRYLLQLSKNTKGYDDSLAYRIEEHVQLQLDKHAIQNPHGTPEEFSFAFDDFADHRSATVYPPNYEKLRGRRNRVRKQHLERMEHRPTPDYV